MNVLVTNKCVFAFRRSLHLDSGVVQLVLSSAQICHNAQSFHRLIGLDMGTQSEFVNTDWPNMEVMDLSHSFELFYLLKQRLNVNFIRGPFHHHENTMFEYRYSGKADNNWEQVSAYWICQSVLRLEVNNYRSNDDTNTHKHIS